ncbi:MAG TPA: hypothetical protein DDY68_00550 [Porphyromonadaceae bacterium]|nr:hypothetical protein [Porphyromonadaceae bacterium]
MKFHRFYKGIGKASTLSLLFVVFLLSSCAVFRRKKQSNEGPVYIKLTEEQIKERERRKHLKDSLLDSLDSISSFALDSLQKRDSVDSLKKVNTPSVIPQEKPQIILDKGVSAGGAISATIQPAPLQDTTQEKKEEIQDTISTQPKKDEGKSRVYLLHADKLAYNKKIKADAQLLKGDVRFRHDSTYMFCDSAYFYKEKNSFDAFGHTRIMQGDSIRIYGDELYYDGSSRTVRLRNNVKLENKQVTLLTDSLDYDRNANIATYIEWGLIADSTNILTSINGEYYPDTDIALFKDSVRLENKDLWLVADSLRYNSKTKIATLISPTLIVSTDSTSIVHSDKGDYNTTTNYSVLLNRSIVEKGVRQITGDSIIYDAKDSISLAYGKVEIYDTVQNSTIYGEYGYFKQGTDEQLFVTDSALMVQRSKEDTLYLHADTLRVVNDSTFKILRAYHGVRIYRTSVQGVCDSLEYKSRDSLLTMYDRPVLWNEQNQLTGDTISCFMNDSTIEWAHIRPFAFSIEKVDSLKHYNQISGREMYVYFENGEVRRIYVEGNVQTIYYPKDSDEEISGMNSSLSSYLSGLLKEKKLDRLVMWPKVDGTMYPLSYVNESNSILKDFKLFDIFRPTSPRDVFRKIKRTDEVNHIIHQRTKTK